MRLEADLIAHSELLSVECRAEVYARACALRAKSQIGNLSKAIAKAPSGFLITRNQQRELKIQWSTGIGHCYFILPWVRVRIAVFGILCFNSANISGRDFGCY